MDMEMSNGKHKKSQIYCLAALPFNPYFEEEVKRIRKEYNIPDKWEEALYWYYDHLRTYTQDKKQKTIFDTTIPLEKEIIVLLVRFGLPFTRFWTTLYYIILNRKIFLDPKYATEPSVDIKPDYEWSTLELRVNVSRINIWTTKKQWTNIWNQIKFNLEDLEEVYREKFGIVVSGRKSASPVLLLEQMKRWSEWYQLSEIQRLGPVRALGRWEEDHPDERGKFDLSTVTKAIGNFREIITPIPIEDLNL